MRKRVNAVISFLPFVLLFLGCTSVPWLSPSAKSGVFTEVATSGAPPSGFVDLIVKASLKTSSEGRNVLWKDDPHGKADYPFRFTVDGQTVTWKADRVAEGKPLIGESVPENPEHGIGVEYLLKKRIRLAAGEHVASFSLPVEDYRVAVGIDLREGVENILEFKPVYNEMYQGKTRNFLFGVKQFEVFFNGERIK